MIGRLLDLLDRIWNPRHDDWRAYGSSLLMWRWNGSAWESRPMTVDEYEEAEWWLAHR